jgi:two-component system, OmpR family, sensor histidine kinase VanS
MHSNINFLQNFRAKMVLLFGLSMFLSGIITFIIFKGLQFYYHAFVDYGDKLTIYRQLMRSIGDINFFLLFFIPLSFLFFYLLTNRYSVYFNQISAGIHYLAQGDFSHTVKITSKDEFERIAQDINQASQNLKDAIERGDFSESSKDQLIVNLAHDLRTPLTSVLGYIDLLLKEEKLTEEQVNHYLRIAQTKSQRLEKLIDELFEITRMNYGMLPLNRRHIDLSDLLHQLKEELYPVFEKNHLTVRMNMPSNMPITGDGELLARVFENLLTNASRYGADGHFIDINGFAEPGEAAIIQIVNYGNTIPEDNLPHLFDLFYTGDKARVEHEGTGLGLFIAKNIVERHEGTITAESSLAQTLFEVRLPAESSK